MEEKTPLQKVVDIFVDYYGEDRVDLQGNTIMVYFPRVTVTNENDRSVEITELYVKVVVDSDGRLRGTFTLNRSEYTAEQYYSGYMHSHVSGIPKYNHSAFQSSCLGNGPIRDTCSSLNTTFDEYIWNLFVLELDKYVHTESISGVPYKYLERIGSPNSGSHYFVGRVVTIPNIVVENPITDAIMDLLLRRFLPYVIEKRPFRFNFIGQYSIADSPYNIVIRLSNLFIEWFNTSLSSEEQGVLKPELIGTNTLIVCKVSNGVIIRKELNRIGIPNFNGYRRLIGRPLWTFKDREVTLNITNISENENITTLPEDENSSILLHPDVVIYFVQKLLRVINYKYGKTERFVPGEETIYL